MLQHETTPHPVDPAIEPYIERFRATMEAEGVTIDDARKRYAALLAEQGNPDGPVRTLDLEIPTRHGAMRARHYRPANETSALLFYMHGGGFAVGDLESVDMVLHTISQRAGIAILSVDYALAPEHPYPVALEQCRDALVWADANRDTLGGPGPLALGGDSAGGNLTALLSRWAASEGGPRITWQAVINPVLDFLALDNEISGSHALYGASPMLSTDTMLGFMSSYFPDERSKVEASPLQSAFDDSILPPTFLAAGQCDALRDEATAYAHRLAVAGVPISFSVYPGMTHNFITLTRYTETARRFVADFAEQARRWAADATSAAAVVPDTTSP